MITVHSNIWIVPLPNGGFLMWLSAEDAHKSAIRIREEFGHMPVPYEKAVFTHQGE